MLVDGHGLATVVGAGPAYFVLADHFPERAEPHQPLTYCGFRLWRLAAGQTFDLAHRPATGDYTVDVSDGVILSNPY